MAPAVSNQCPGSDLSDRFLVRVKNCLVRVPLLLQLPYTKCCLWIWALYTHTHTHARTHALSLSLSLSLLQWHLFCGGYLHCFLPSVTDSLTVKKQFRILVRGSPSLRVTGYDTHVFPNNAWNLIILTSIPETHTVSRCVIHHLVSVCICHASCLLCTADTNIMHLRIPLYAGNIWNATYVTEGCTWFSAIVCDIYILGMSKDIC
jgi:hypothetical protein